MGRARIEFHYDGFNALRSDPVVQEMLDAAGQRIADAAGGGDDFISESAPSSTRSRTIVTTNSFQGQLAEAYHGALSKALEAGSG